MFQVNDMVVYGSQSVCTITEISERKIGRERVLYYALHPVFDSKSAVFIPCSNDGLTAKMRPILTQEQVDALLVSLRSESLPWVENESARKEQYGEILKSGDRLALARLIRALYLHKQRQKKVGKKLHVCDELLLDRAQKLLNEELAYVLKIQPSEVPTFIGNAIGEDPTDGR